MGFLLALHLLILTRTARSYEDFVQVPLSDGAAVSDVPQLDGAIGAPRDDVILHRNHAADVLLVAKTDGLDVERLREMANEHLLIAIAGREIVPDAHLLLRRRGRTHKLGYHAGAMTDEERLLIERRDRVCGDVSDLVPNEQILLVVELARDHGGALLVDVSTTHSNRETYHMEVTSSMLERRSSLITFSTLVSAIYCSSSVMHPIRISDEHSSGFPMVWFLRNHRGSRRPLQVSHEALLLLQERLVSL